MDSDFNPTEILDESELAYLESLQKDKKWIDILQKIREFKQPPIFTPTNADPKTLYYRWVYESGVLKGIKGLVSLLHGRETPITLIQEDK